MISHITVTYVNKAYYENATTYRNTVVDETSLCPLIYMSLLVHIPGHMLKKILTYNQDN